MAATKGIPTPPIAPIVGAGGIISRDWLIFVDRLIQFIKNKNLFGPAADRPPAGDVYPGTVYFETDTLLTFISTGTTWEPYTQAGVVVDPAGALYGDGTVADPLAVRVDGVSMVINVSNELEATGVGAVVVVDPAGALDGDGSAGSPLAVRVDGVTVTINGSNELEATSGGGNTTDSTAFGSEPGSPATGDLDLYNNSFYISRYSGSAWAPWGPIFPMVPPDDSAFSWVNQGPASVDTTYGGIYLTSPADATPSLRCRVKTLPAAPYVITAALLPHRFVGNYQSIGLLWRDSGSGKITTVSYGFDLAATTVGFIRCDKWTDAVTYNSSYAGKFDLIPGAALFIQMSDDGANRGVAISFDMRHWTPVLSVGNTDFLTPDQVGIYVNPQNASYGAGQTLISYEEA